MTYEYDEFADCQSDPADDDTPYPIVRHTELGAVAPGTWRFNGDSETGESWLTVHTPSGKVHELLRGSFRPCDESLEDHVKMQVRLPIIVTAPGGELLLLRDVWGNGWVHKILDDPRLDDRKKD
jgi:hypothetical protein